LLASAFLATAFATTSGLLSGWDEAAHMDYAYQLWRGRLPVFEDGLLVAPGFGHVPHVQWVSQHPPLFYLLEAPVVGPFIDRHMYVWAVFAGRAVNVLITVAVVAAVMWAAAKVVPRRPDVWLLAGSVAAINPWVIRVGGSIYNDNFGAVWSALVVGCTAWIARSGPTRWRLLIFGVCATAAFGSRIHLALVVAVCAVVLVLAWLFERPVRRRAIVGLASACAVAALAWSWFYLRNWKLSGSITGGHPEYWAGTTRYVRKDVGLVQAVQKVDQWLSLLRFYGWDDVHKVGGVLLWLIPVSVVGAVAARSWRKFSREDLLVGTALVAVGGSIVALQMWYAAGAGAPIPRYLLPALVPISIGIAWFLGFAPRWWNLVVAGWIALALGGFPWWMWDSLRSAGPPAAGADVVAWVSVSCGALAVCAAVATARLAAERDA
jgi:MFS family permease